MDTNLQNTPQTPLSCSVVIPVYNSQATLVELVNRLENVFLKLGNPFEVILVDDGSGDGSWQTIQELAANHTSVQGLKMMRNYGQHNALLCGVRNARNEVVITMDDDLQHPPEEIPNLLVRLAEGFDVVYGIPRKLPHEWWRNIFSKLTKRVLAYVMGIPTIRDIGSFRAFRASLRDAFETFQGPNVILDVLLSWGTTRFATTPINETPRQVGVSNYNFAKLFGQAMLVLTGFSTAPLRFASMLGFFFTLFGIVILAYVVIITVSAGSIPGFPFLASIIAIFSGTQLFALGIFGEYMARIFDRSMDRPSYVIQMKTRQDDR